MKYIRMLIPILVLALYLGIYEGKVALFRQGHKVPVQVYEVSADSFPQKERAALQAGIPIEDRKQLAKLLEAYLS